MSNVGSVHMQVGSGALALGLVIPVMSKARLKSIILNRRPKPGAMSVARCSLLKNQKDYIFKSGDSGNSLEKVNNIDFYYFDENLPDILFSSPELILTTAVTPSGLLPIVPFITNFLEKRRTICDERAFTYIVACENLRENSNELKKMLLEYAKEINLGTDFSGFINSQCGFLDTVVDRVCVLSDDPVEGQPIVKVEPNYCWIIDKSPLYESGERIEVIEARLGTSIDFVSRRDYRFYERRKTWFVNGGQLALAAYAKDYNEEYLNRAISRPEISKRIKLLFKAFTLALEYYRIKLGIHAEDDKSYAGIAGYALDVMARFEQISDTFGRILRPLLKPASALENMYETITSLQDHRSDNIAVRETINCLVDFLDIQQFTGKIVNRIIEGVEYLQQYDYNSGGKFFKEEPEISIEIMSLYQTCIKQINNELGLLLNDVRKAIKNMAI